MDSITTVCVLGSLVMIAAISFWLRKSMLRSNGGYSLSVSVQLAVLGFALITSGAALQLNRVRMTPEPIIERLLDSFGFLFVVAGLAVLFILFCLSRGFTPPLSKPTAERENSVGEYLR